MVPLTAQSNGWDSVVDIFKEGTISFDGRYRFEFKEDGNREKVARASTFRMHAGYETAEYFGLQGFIEGEHIAPVGQDNYNDLTNGKTEFPMIYDSVGTELNQAYLTWSSIPDTTIKAGRYRLNLDNRRYIGDVLWRQNDQTHDGFTLRNRSIPDLTLFYGYSYNVNRPAGNDFSGGDWAGDIHLLNARYDGFDIGRVTLYSYLLDLDIARFSSKTHGISLKGNTSIKDNLILQYRLEAATQQDYAGAPVDYSANYGHLQLALVKDELKFTMGWEVLESDKGNATFQTPLDGWHIHNGWADVFIHPPAMGLEDLYATLKYTLHDVHPAVDGTKLFLGYHDFTSNEGGLDYGYEWNAEVKKMLNDTVDAGLRYANYRADDYWWDTQRLIFTLRVNYSR